MFKVPNQHRLDVEMSKRLTAMYSGTKGCPNFLAMVSDPSRGDEGYFFLPNIKTGKGLYMLCLASNGMGWEHVSVSIPTDRRCPTWEEMCFVKDQFWNDPDDVVIQYHPAKKDYVNNHEFCLHLWRKKDTNFETPPSIMVGIKT